MTEESSNWHRPKAWIILVGVIILLIFLYFYQPFETYLITNIPHIHFSNVIFWFASLVAVIAYAIAHWQAFRQRIINGDGQLQVESLVFDILQIAILTAVIFTAGATLQAIEVLSEYMMNRGPVFDRLFGEKLLAIILLVILTILFYLLHHAVRSFHRGWNPRRPPPRIAAAKD